MKNITLNNVKDTAFLANESYKNAVENDENINKEKEMYKGKPLTNPATNSSFQVVEQTNEDGGGFSGTVFKNTETNEYVITFRGTEIGDVWDYLDDVSMSLTNTGLLGGLNSEQFNQAFAFASKQIAEILAKDPDAKISFTGHSLGGALAAAVGAKLNMEAMTFNAYPIKKYIENILSKEEQEVAQDKVLNFYDTRDPISNGTYGGEHFGKSVALDTGGSLILDFFSKSGPLRELSYIYKHLIDNLTKAIQSGNFDEKILSVSLYDPIALDLNANGKIDTLSLENGVFFDHNGDKVAFKSSWVNSSDGILARDINGDGKITSGAELFGNFTKLKNGELAKNGAQALKDLDDNNDGIFDSNDKAFNEILVWQDKNSDGISQKNELKTLNEHNIKSIDLEFMADNTALDKDNKQILIGSFSTNISNESKNNLASDIDFSVDTIQRNILDDTDGIIKGTGFVRNFNLSLNDEIKNAYESYKTLNTKQQQLSNVETLVNLWAKTAKEYNEIQNPIQKAKINISSVASGTTSSGINEAIKRAEAGEITLGDGVKISA